MYTNLEFVRTRLYSGANMEIAAACNTSPGVVSQVLNGTYYNLQTPTAKRVASFATRLAYERALIDLKSPRPEDRASAAKDLPKLQELVGRV